MCGAQELVPWEEHLISLSFPRTLPRLLPSNPLPAALMQLLTFCAEKNGNVPPLVGASVRRPAITHSCAFTDGA